MKDDTESSTFTKKINSSKLCIMPLESYYLSIWNDIIYKHLATYIITLNQRQENQNRVKLNKQKGSLSKEGSETQ